MLTSLKNENESLKSDNETWLEKFKICEEGSFFFLFTLA